MNPFVLNLSEITPARHRVCRVVFSNKLLRIAVPDMQLLDVPRHLAEPLREITVRFGAVARAVIKRQTKLVVGYRIGLDLLGQFADRLGGVFGLFEQCGGGLKVYLLKEELKEVRLAET